MKGPLQPIAAQEQQLEPQERSLAAGAKGNASLLATTTKMSVTTTTHSPSPPPPVFEPVDDAPVAFAKSLALAKKVAETGDASVDLGGEDENGKREKSGGTINVDAPGGVAALLSRVLRSSADLEGRCVGRNRDDAGAIRSGLVELAPAVGALERRAAAAGGGVAEVNKKRERGFSSSLGLLTKPAKGEGKKKLNSPPSSPSLLSFSLPPKTSPPPHPRQAAKTAGSLEASLEQARSRCDSLSARLSAAEAEGAALARRLADADAAAGEACYLAAAEVASDAAAAAAAAEAKGEENVPRSSRKSRRKSGGKGRQQQQNEGDDERGAAATAAAAAPPPSAGGPFIVLGRLELGSTLRVASARGSPPPAGAAIQWMRKAGGRGREGAGRAPSGEGRGGGGAGGAGGGRGGGGGGGGGGGAERERERERGWRQIPGATRPSYAPEPDDVGARLACRLGGARSSGGASPCSPSPSPARVMLVAAAGTVAPSPGGARHVLALLSSGGGVFPAAVVAGPCGGSRSGSGSPPAAVPLLSLVLDSEGAGLRRTASPSPCSSDEAAEGVGSVGGGDWVVRAPWHAGMAACGARGGGGGAAQALFLSFGGGGARPSFVLALQSPRARNAALSLARALSERAGVRLGSVDDDDDDSGVDANRGAAAGLQTRAEDSGERPAALRF